MCVVPGAAPGAVPGAVGVVVNIVVVVVVIPSTTTSTTTFSSSLAFIAHVAPCMDNYGWIIMDGWSMDNYM